MSKVKAWLAHKFGMKKPKKGAEVKRVGIDESSLVKILNSVVINVSFNHSREKENHNSGNDFFTDTINVQLT